MVDPVVELQSGSIRGIIEKHEEGFDYYAFKGIPYAEPPLGDLRFKDPVQIRKWTGVMECQSFGPICMQTDGFSHIISHSEDCLHLNVYTKTIDKPNANIPVMVVIHGGAFMFGSSNDLYFGPEYLIRKNVVLVTFNYRFSVLGFLNLEDEICPGNQGLKDQIMVLQWIRDNIRVFGGDPGNVTILGSGSGGICSHFLALSPLTKGLIHKVITQSADIYTLWYKVYNPKSEAIKLCSLLGKELIDSKEIVDFLRTVDAAALHEARLRFTKSVVGQLHFGPWVDDQSQYPVMPVDPVVAANQGVHLPYLVGHTGREGILFLLGMSIKEFFDMCNEDFGAMLQYNAKDLLDCYDLTEAQVRRLYYKSEVVSVENLSKYVDLTSDIYFFEGIHRLARVQAENISAATYLYVYNYDHEEAVSRKLMKDAPSGVGHLDELPMLFKMRILESLRIDYVKKGTRAYRMMEQMTELWTNFAAYGRPTVSKTDLIPVHWKPINDGTMLRYLNLDEDITMQSTINVDQKLLSAKNIKV